MSFVKPARAVVVDQCFKIDSFSTLLPQPSLDLIQHKAPDTLPLPVGSYIDRDDVAEPPRFVTPDHEADYLFFILGDNRPART